MTTLCAIAILILSVGGDTEIYVRIDPTVFDPALGGINCDVDCSTIGASIPFDESAYGQYAACPFPEVPRWSTLIITGSWRALADGSYYCVDDGGRIVIDDDGTVSVDLLLPYAVLREPLIASIKVDGGHCGDWTVVAW